MVSALIRFCIEQRDPSVERLCRLFEAGLDEYGEISTGMEAIHTLYDATGVCDVMCSSLWK